MSRWLAVAAILMAAIALRAEEQQTEQKAEPAFYPHNIGAGAGVSLCSV